MSDESFNVIIKPIGDFRMKREVASSLVERGVAERVRLTHAYEKKKTELQKQHEAVKSQLNEHKEKVGHWSLVMDVPN